MKRKILILLLSIIILIGGIFIWSVKKHEFTQEKWNHEPSERMDIVDDLLSTHDLIGMPRERVTRLLGSDSDSAAEGKGIRYNLGPEPGLFGFFSIDDAWLVLYFNKDGLVSHYEVTTD
ncbi:hypothetical protein V1498_13205 [Peribacillus sp. SCS-26]|uniref:hypothetical protein n=1 Tax=Paraperibacillus marinus TaxID=3115295 RepID=UPI003906927D